MRRVLLLLTLALPLVSAQGEVVDIVRVETPARTMAEQPFSANVTVQNRGGPVTLDLLAALYSPGATDCGPATDPSFRGFTHLVQERLDLAPGETRVIADWRNAYGQERVEAKPREMTWCVFAARSDGTRLDYLDVEVVALSARGENARPTASFSWSPERPRVAEDVRFVARGQDADGDPVTFAWDFGRFDASGRARAEGEVATHAFYPEGTYTVTLTASDGLETMTMGQVLDVATGAAAPPEDEERPTPAPLALTLAAVASASLAATSWRHPRPRPRSR